MCVRIAEHQGMCVWAALRWIRDISSPVGKLQVRWRFQNLFRADEVLGVDADFSLVLGCDKWPADLRAFSNYHASNIKDWGGLCSTIDWQVPLCSAWKDPLAKVRAAIISKAMPSSILLRLRERAAAPCKDPFFASTEIQQLRVAVCEALNVEVSWAPKTFEHTPYLFNLLQVLAERMDDPDASLCQILSKGAPTGIRRPIPASGIWPAKEQLLEADIDLDLVLCESSHVSAEAEPTTVVCKIWWMKKLIKDTWCAGAWQKSLLGRQLGHCGKFGLIRKAGKSDRLIGDSKASGASPAAPFSSLLYTILQLLQLL